MQVNFNKRAHFILEIIVFLLILLWVYAGLSKMLDLRQFKWQIRNQVLSPLLQRLVINGLIPIEFIAAILLYFQRTRNYGLILSAVLLIAFTTYIALVTLHFFDRIPCSCGGILERMSWNVHFWFNLTFLASTLTALFISRERRSKAT